MANVFLTWTKGQNVVISANGSSASGVIQNGNLLTGGAGSVQIQALLVDAVLEEIHTMESEVTSSPIEQGPDASDHVRPKPRTYVISDGLVSDSPVPSAATGVMAGVRPDPTRPGQAYQTLVEIWESQTLLTIATGIELYTNMVMTSCPVKRNAKNGNSLRFSATFQEIQIVSSQTIDVPKIAKGKATSDLGKVTGTPPAKAQTALHSLVNSNGGPVNAGILVH